MEQNKTFCKICKQLKFRIEDGKFPDGKNKKWKDESGKQWNGKYCYSCNLIRVKTKMKEKRTKTL